MKQQTFVDTSALYALLDADDPIHETAKRAWIDAIDRDRVFVTTHYVFVETHAVTLRRLGRAAIQDLDGIARAIDIVAVSDDLLAAARARWQSDNRRQLSLVDCCSFEFMKAHAIHEALAYDRHFRENQQE